MGDAKITVCNKIPHSVKTKNTIEEIHQETLVFKPLDLQEISVSLQRMYRFKYPSHDRSRVFKEILTKHTISPKISLKNYYSYKLSTIYKLVQTIWNTSIQLLGGGDEFSDMVNAYLSYEETTYFSSKKLIDDILQEENLKFQKIDNIQNATDEGLKQKLIREAFKEGGFELKKNITEENFYTELYISFNTDYPINIDGFFEICGKKQLTLQDNIKRLGEITKKAKKLSKEKTENISAKLLKFSTDFRKQHSAIFPIRLLIIAEGATEEKLLPVFMNTLDINFKQEGIYLLPAGGKNQVNKIYEFYSQALNIPILIILDSDASSIAKKIEEKLKPTDKIYLIPEGEFEDLLSEKLICRAVNSLFGIIENITPEDIHQNPRMTSNLATIWKEKGLGEFNKSEFAEIISECVKNSNDLSPTLIEISKLIKDYLK